MSDKSFSSKMQEKKQLLRQFLAWRLAVRLEPFTRQIGKTVTGENGEDVVHDLRLSCRKLRTLIKNFQFLFPAKEYRASSQALKTLTGKLGVIRELDVLAKEITKAREETYVQDVTHGLAVLSDTIQRIGDDKGELVSNFVEKFSAAPGFFTIIEFVAQHHHLDSLGIVCQNSYVRQSAQKILRRQFQQIVEFSKRLNVDKPGEDFHQLRISLKYFRYSLEDFSCLQRDGFEMQLKKVCNILDLMGNIHDRQVWLSQMYEILAVIEETNGLQTKDYKDAVFAAAILRRNWNRKITSEYADFKKILGDLQQDHFWDLFRVNVIAEASKQGSDPIASESENEHLENLPDSAPK